MSRSIQLDWLEDLPGHFVHNGNSGHQFSTHRRDRSTPPKTHTARRCPCSNGYLERQLLYKTLLEHEPDHPLVREAVREVLEDQCDAPRAFAEAQRIYSQPLEIYDLPRPSPFALPLFTAFNREVLLASDPERALDDLWRASTLNGASCLIHPVRPSATMRRHVDSRELYG